MSERCIYCGGDTLTRDHVPSRILLDEPFPSNLPVVPACDTCNNGFSKDEEYVACLIECALHGEVTPDVLRREKIRRILTEKPLLSSRLSSVLVRPEHGAIHFSIEDERVRNVILKLARGHAFYELNELFLDLPTSLSYAPLLALEPAIVAKFEKPPVFSMWPEVGSRAMQRMVEGHDMCLDGWIIVQEVRYRYLATTGTEGLIIRIVLSEYLACEVFWSD